MAFNALADSGAGAALALPEMTAGLTVASTPYAVTGLGLDLGNASNTINGGN
jgi:hypothetical protein